MITDRSQCWHDRATVSIGPTTNQRTRYCPDCGLSTTDWPDDLQQARERVAAAGGPSLGELRGRLVGVPDVSGTVNLAGHVYTASDLVRRVVRNLPRGRAAARGVFWSKVRDAFAVGSTVAQAMCVVAGLDPDTGKDTPTITKESL